MSFDYDQAAGLRNLGLSHAYDVEFICASDKKLAALCLSERLQQAQLRGKQCFLLDAEDVKNSQALEAVLAGDLTAETFFKHKSLGLVGHPLFLLCTDYQSVDKINAWCVDHAKVTFCIDNNAECLMQAYLLIKSLIVRKRVLNMAVWGTGEALHEAKKFVGTVKQFLDVELSLELSKI